MKTIKSFLGYTWAVTAFIIALATFLGNDFFGRTLAAATGVTVNPWYTGGDIIKSVDHGKYRTLMHRPVFDSLIGQKKTGFIQINWEPAAGLPQIINEGFDFDSDNKEDFRLILNTTTGKIDLKTDNAAVLSVEKGYRLRNGWAVRILLERQP
ncbi:MAG: hypothetical protein AB2L12_08965 [Smithellaceae bacterium]